MSIFKFIENLNYKVKELDKKATNPFINMKNQYDPLKNGFSQTYVWIEEEKSTKEK